MPIGHVKVHKVYKNQAGFVFVLTEGLYGLIDAVVIIVGVYFFSQSSVAEDIPYLPHPHS